MHTHRESLFGMALGLACVAAATPAVVPVESDRPRRRSYSRFGSIAQANRWTGQPHEHKREIARRLRQEARRG